MEEGGKEGEGKGKGGIEEGGTCSKVLVGVDAPGAMQEFWLESIYHSVPVVIAQKELLRVL